MDDLELLIGLLGEGQEFDSAGEELRRQYYSHVRAFLARLLPFCGESEISREAENVLAQFAIAVQRGAVQDETAICSTLIKECRRAAAGVVKGLSNDRISGDGAPSASQCDSIRQAVRTIGPHEKVALRGLLSRPGATDRELFMVVRATKPTITLLDVIEARRQLVKKVREVIDGTKDDTG
jgi:hypothetical protein